MKSIQFDCNVIQPFFESAHSFEYLDEFSANVFIVDTNQFLHKLDYCKSLLNKNDLMYASKMRIESDFHRKIISRTILKLLLSKMIELPIDAIDIDKDEYGKPFCRKAILKSIHFSISDSSSFVCIVIGKTLVGADIEIKRPDFQYQDIALTSFHQNELAQLNASKDKLPLFYLFWTRKESFLKMYGSGLNDELSHLDMTDGEKVANIPYFNQNDQFRVSSFYINARLVGSISVPETIKQLRFFNYIATDLD